MNEVDSCQHMSTMSTMSTVIQVAKVVPPELVVQP